MSFHKINTFLWKQKSITLNALHRISLKKLKPSNRINGKLIKKYSINFL